MTIEEIKEGVNGFEALIAKITAGKVNDSESIEQYDVENHAINDSAKRPDKQFINDKNENETSYVSRLAVPFQKKIVSRAATFLCGNPIALNANPQDEKEKSLLAAVEKVWEDNKLDYKSKTLAEYMMSETKAAELWYIEKLDPEEDYWGDTLKSEFRLRIRILANSLGDSLYPVYDPTGNMIAFGRGYTVEDGDKKEEHFDLYTDDTVYEGIKPDGGEWKVVPTANVYTKIPVIYYSQPQPEWNDVQSLIDRYEEQLSNLADTNDYFGSPLLAVTGVIKGFAKKGESGKVIQLDNQADIKYVTWDMAPEATKLEMETIEKLIFAMTDTPNDSFEQMKSLGVFSGIALKMLFLAAHMKASKKEEIFGEGIQRRINYIKHIIARIDGTFSKVRLSIKPKFEYFLPKNDAEKIETLISAVQGGIMSTNSAIRQNPLIEDADAEIDEIDNEKSGPGALDNLMNQ